MISNKRYAIIGSFHYHLECIGFLQHLLGIVGVYVNQDNFKYIEYFQTLYDFKSYNISSFDSSNYDCIIKLSSDDNCLNMIKTEDTHKVISLLHLSGLERGSKNLIKLSHLITSQETCEYIFPYYKTKNTGIFEKKTIMYVGFFDTWQVTSDLITFIKESNYKFYFCLNTETEGSKKLKSMKNVIVFYNLSTQDLNTVLQNATFILGRIRRIYDRFTGSLSLSISNKIPIISPKKIAGSTPGILFENEYCEVLNYVKNMSQEEYNNILETINDYINVSEEENKKHFQILLDNIVPK